LLLIYRLSITTEHVTCGSQAEDSNPRQIQSKTASGHNMAQCCRQYEKTLKGIFWSRAELNPRRAARIGKWKSESAPRAKDGLKIAELSIGGDSSCHKHERSICI
jgi:hypothetical protein